MGIILISVAVIHTYCQEMVLVFCPRHDRVLTRTRRDPIRGMLWYCPLCQKWYDYDELHKQFQETLSEKLEEESLTESISKPEILAPQEKPEAPLQHLMLTPQAKRIERKISIPSRRPIGRVTLSKDTPATPTEFYCWIEDKPDLDVQPGTIITALSDSNKVKEELVQVIGIVTDVKAFTASASPLDDFYSHEYGNPAAEPPTNRPVIRIAKVQTIHRSDGKASPPSANWKVYFADEEEIQRAYNSLIDDKHGILAGFTFDSNNKPVPIFVHSEYLLGYQSAHLNIAGASGLATKTSYALFLICNILSWAKRFKQKVAAIAFNVKEVDLIGIDDIYDSWEMVYDVIGKGNLHKDLWEKTVELGFDAIDILKHNVRYFIPYGEYSEVKQAHQYYYGLMDLVMGGSSTLRMLFEREDLDDKTLSLLDAIVQHVRRESGTSPYSFRRLLDFLQGLVGGRAEQTGGRSRGGRRSEWVSIDSTLHHVSTITKVINRIQGSLSTLENLISSEEPYGKPIRVERLRPHEFWVCDIHNLPDKGKRLVFLSVINSVYQLLEAKKKGRQTITMYGDEINLTEFPDRVIIFVDELNKFAPSGSKYVPLKAPIIDIVSRGRSIGLSLIGAEQMASQVDEEILVNTATFAVGRSHPLEVETKTYRWLEKGLREMCFVLEKGQLFLWHAIHHRPVMIRFPMPLHLIKREVCGYAGTV